MSTLANLTNEECDLLIELLEREAQKLRLRCGSVSARGQSSEPSRRREILERLLWNARMACLMPTPDDAELREIGSYC